MQKIKRVLISVSNKAGLVEFAKRLSELGCEILSTGGTAKLWISATDRTSDTSAQSWRYAT